MGAGSGRAKQPRQWQWGDRCRGISFSQPRSSCQRGRIGVARVLKSWLVGSYKHGASVALVLLWSGAAIILTSLFRPSAADAGTFSGPFTGYAMGNLQGASGQVLQTTDFANHHPNYCPNDPAAWWPYGTVIIEDEIIIYPDGSGDVFFSRVSTLKDIGDFNCVMGNYWVDIYFGRWKRSGEACSCPGVVSPGVCSLGQDNSCNWAIAFGVQTRGYSKQ